MLPMPLTGGVHGLSCDHRLVTVIVLERNSRTDLHAQDAAILQLRHAMPSVILSPSGELFVVCRRCVFSFGPSLIDS
ncbi:unnamed protein product [Soboliphyme baturini]|uniref:Secreted protein n=1 Tax=Soboliphyme baturini TaxID=241478 RepID=A0A183IGC5_9BILA|nr:unnamed protein product [Soboliphyme baturini]